MILVVQNIDIVLNIFLFIFNINKAIFLLRSYFLINYLYMLYSLTYF